MYIYIRYIYLFLALWFCLASSTAATRQRSAIVDVVDVLQRQCPLPLTDGFILSQITAADEFLEMNYQLLDGFSLQNVNDRVLRRAAINAVLADEEWRKMIKVAVKSNMGLRAVFSQGTERKVVTFQVKEVEAELKNGKSQTKAKDDFLGFKMWLLNKSLPKKLADGCQLTFVGMNNDILFGVVKLSADFSEDEDVFVALRILGEDYKRKLISGICNDRLFKSLSENCFDTGRNLRLRIEEEETTRIAVVDVSPDDVDAARTNPLSDEELALQYQVAVSRTRLPMTISDGIAITNVEMNQQIFRFTVQMTTEPSAENLQGIAANLKSSYQSESGLRRLADCCTKTNRSIRYLLVNSENKTLAEIIINQ